MEKTISVEVYQNEVKEAEVLCTILTKPELQKVKESVEHILLVVSLACSKDSA